MSEQKHSGWCGALGEAHDSIKWTVGMYTFSKIADSLKSAFSVKAVVIGVEICGVRKQRSYTRRDVRDRCQEQMTWSELANVPAVAAHLTVPLTNSNVWKFVPPNSRLRAAACGSANQSMHFGRLSPKIIADAKRVGGDNLPVCLSKICEPISIKRKKRLRRHQAMQRSENRAELASLLVSVPRRQRIRILTGSDD